MVGDGRKVAEILLRIQAATLSDEIDNFLDENGTEEKQPLEGIRHTSSENIYSTL